MSEKPFRRHHGAVLRAPRPPTALMSTRLSLALSTSDRHGVNMTSLCLHFHNSTATLASLLAWWISPLLKRTSVHTVFNNGNAESISGWRDWDLSLESRRQRQQTLLSTYSAYGSLQQWGSPNVSNSCLAFCCFMISSGPLRSRQVSVYEQHLTPGDARA